jgi:CheY-like chemotaxis protein
MNNVKILIAEDDDLSRILLKVLLLKWIPEVKVNEAFNGKEAVEQFLKEKPDIIFMDINMPIMNGLMAAREIRQLENKIRVPIISISAYEAWNTDQISPSRSLIDDFLPKPLLKEAVGEILIGEMVDS